ncbi:MAG: Hint domain-containing protein, partial [Pseudomonadota bacterium]
VKWLGEQRVKTSMFTPSSLMPVCIAKGALGGDLPHTDLFVSADHGLMLDGYVVNASALVNGSTIRFVPMAEMGQEFTYYHIETEAHDAVLANGAAAETFIDPAGRKGFDNYAEYLDLYGADHMIPAMDRSRISSARTLPDSVKARLSPDVDWETRLDNPQMVVSVSRGPA